MRSKKNYVAWSRTNPPGTGLAFWSPWPYLCWQQQTTQNRQKWHAWHIGGHDASMMGWPMFGSVLVPKVPPATFEIPNYIADLRLIWNLERNSSALTMPLLDSRQNKQSFDNLTKFPDENAEDSSFAKLKSYYRTCNIQVVTWSWWSNIVFFWIAFGPG